MGKTFSQAMQDLARRIVAEAREKAENQDLYMPSVAEVLYDNLTDDLWTELQQEVYRVEVQRDEPKH